MNIKRILVLTGCFRGTLNILLVG